LAFGNPGQSTSGMSPVTLINATGRTRQ
jgi:hypothetical protein